MKMCQECHQGKHQNCDGVADLDELDLPVFCSCDDGLHPMRDELDFGTD